MWCAKGTKYLFVHLPHPLSKEMAIKKLVKGVFQEHFEFLHWVHDYVHRTYPDAMRLGNAYARREQILQKSGDAAVNLNLIPKHSWVHTSAALQHATCIVRSLQPPPAKGAPPVAKSSGPTKTKARVETKQTTAASKNKLQRTQALLQLLVEFLQLLCACLMDVVAAAACQQEAAPYLTSQFVPGQFTSSSFFACFRPQDQIFKFLDTMVARTPNNTLTKFTISKTFVGRPIPAYKLSSALSSNHSTIVVLSMMHAREWITAPATVYAIASLVDDFVTKNTPLPYDWVFVPIVNLDGYVATWTTDERLRRKNVNPLGANIPYDAVGDSSQSGVDLNRNYGPLSVFNLVPTLKSSLTYPGPAPYSEPETVGIHTWLQSHPEVVGAIDVHSYAGLLLTPFGSTTNTPDAPFNDKFTALGATMQDSILKATGVLYNAQPASKLYLAYGTFGEYFFRVYGKPSVTFELKGKSFIVPSTTIPGSGDHVVAVCRSFAEGIPPFMANLPAPTTLPPNAPRNSGLHHVASIVQIKAHELRTKTKSELLAELDDYQQELAQLRVAKVTGGAASKLAKIKLVRRSIARVLTVYNQTQKARLREKLGQGKHVPVDLREKKTRAIRRALTPEEKSIKTLKQQKKDAYFPKRRFAVKA
ncbi:hypothetical protein DYB36_002421 [Aphanomyces astaci]|uniref:Peptidase M14 domain-containing protein n=6 Tax=Aphanomyces astaci TaxID=112090 RepID=A0A397ATI6_APHAT|nr:hypothetical protein DYB36_002421 [Aphanomyces astaci]